MSRFRRTGFGFILMMLVGVMSVSVASANEGNVRPPEPTIGISAEEAATGMNQQMSALEHTYLSVYTSTIQIVSGNDIQISGDTSTFST